MKEFKRNYAYNIVLTLTNILFPIITFPYVSRVLGAEGVGKAHFIVSLSQYFALFAGLGIPIYGIREVAKNKNNRDALSRVFSELTFIYIGTSLVVSAVYLLLISSFDYFQADNELYVFSLLLILLGFSSVDWLYSGLGDFKTISVRSLIVKAVSVLSVFTFINSSTDYKIYLYISVFANLGNNLANLFLIRHKVTLTVESLNIKQHIRPLLYIFSTTIATSMYTVLDSVLLGLLSNPRAVGLYSAAVRLTKISLPFITSIGAVTLPELSKGYFEKDESNFKSILQRSFDFIVFFSIPISVGSFLLSEEFILLFSGEGFKEAIVPMRIMSLLPILIGLGFFFGFQVLVPAAKDRQLLISVLVGMVVSVTLNLLLVPTHHAVGGAVANVITELAVMLSYYYYVNRENLFTPSIKSMMHSLATSLVFVPICYFVRELPLGVFWSLLISVCVCAISYVSLQGFLFKNSLLLEIVRSIKNKIR